jgi:hypothetical protein
MSPHVPSCGRCPPSACKGSPTSIYTISTDNYLTVPLHKYGVVLSRDPETIIITSIISFRSSFRGHEARYPFLFFL